MYHCMFGTPTTAPTLRASRRRRRARLPPAGGVEGHPPRPRRVVGHRAKGVGEAATGGEGGTTRLTMVGRRTPP